MEKVRVDKFTMIALEDKGKYGYCLTEGYEGKDGSFKPAFCVREFGKAGEKVNRTVPVNVKLGDRDTAIGVLRTLLAELEG